MIRLILIVPFILVLVCFAASNQDSVQMWLLTWGWTSSVGILALMVAAASFLLGAFSVWVVEFGQRRRARRAEARVRELESALEAHEASSRAAAVTAAPPVTPAAVVPPVSSSASSVP